MENYFYTRAIESQGYTVFHHCMCVTVNVSVSASIGVEASFHVLTCTKLVGSLVPSMGILGIHYGPLHWLTRSLLMTLPHQTLKLPHNSSDSSPCFSLTLLCSCHSSLYPLSSPSLSCTSTSWMKKSTGVREREIKKRKRGRQKETKRIARLHLFTPLLF